MSGGENPDLVALKKLLNSWHVGILYELFKEEDITINELKMMQFSHIYDLLKHNKMGVRIRFEYHLNSWRNKIGMPIKTVECTRHHHHHTICSNCKANIEINSVEDSITHDNLTNTNTSHKNGNKGRRNKDLVNQKGLSENKPPPLSPQSVHSNNSLLNMLTSNEIVNFMPAPAIESTSEKMHNTEDEAEMENLPLNTLTDILSESTYDAPPKFPSKAGAEKCPVTLQQILEMSGPRGLIILKFFKEKNRLTNIHRSQLIQTIVDFFDENDLHLSLNMSHILEWEILKMFPTEKLEYYRTEKRGKMYVKFSNMKRYKRERNNKMRNEMESSTTCIQETNANNTPVGKNTENVDTEYGAKWCGKSDILVKEEGLSDNEIGFQ